MAVRDAKSPTLHKIAQYFDFSLDDLYTDEPEATAPLPSDISAIAARLVPVINKSQCGEWSDFTDLEYPVGVADRYEHAPTSDPSAFYVIASGDSMTGIGINEGDLLLVEPHRRVETGNIVLAKGENGCTVKRFQQRESIIVLLPSNEKYQPIILTEAEIKRDRIRFFRITKVVREV